MKHIKKSAEPSEFTAWKSRKTTSNWDRLKNPTKTKVYNALIADQGGICCYCEVRLRDGFYHIEHIIPRAHDSSLIFDYSNLLCSCQTNLPKGTPLQCGNSKGAHFSKNYFISPLESECERYFTYTSDGRIHGKNTRAKNTITLLNLNEASLVKKREYLIDLFNDPTLSQEEAEEYVQKYLEKKEDGMFNEFWTTINYLFNDS